MASVVGDAPPALYSCKCLNIRLLSFSTADSKPSHLGNDQHWTPVYVGEQGIKIIHPQVTIRNRSREAIVEDASRCVRYTSLTCLVCEALVYRVIQLVSPEVDSREGPLLPTEDWVEHEIMKSTSGWVEVYKQCPAGEEVARLETSADFSPIFSIILPSATPPGSPKPENESESAPQQQLSIVPPLPPPPEPAPKPYLESLRPLFHPAPFTPSHHVFVYLASLAEQQSKQIRAEAEAFIATLVKQKSDEVNKAEDQLRHHVERLWKSFRTGLNKIEKELAATNLSTRRPSLSAERSGVPVHAQGSMVIRTFEPTAVSHVRSPSVMQVSALSTSLATTSFHHPREKATDGVSKPASEDDRSLSSRTLASQSYPVNVAVLATGNGEGSNVLQFKRTTNDSINTVVSYKYFRDLEADMARMKKEHANADEAKQKEVEEQQQQIKQRHEEREQDRAKKASPSAPATQAVEAQGEKSESAGVKRNGQHETEQLSGKDSKGKRKVTFDVEPAVVTIKNDAEAEGEEQEQAVASADNTGEMIFEIDEESASAAVTPDQRTESTPALPLLEPKPQRPRKPRNAHHQRALSASFASLRPSSLPPPSHIRPPRGQHGVDSARPIISREELQRTLAAQQARERAASVTPTNDDATVDPQDPELLRLLAADTPSHRGAWKPGSKAWQTFLQRRDSKRSSRGSEDSGDTVNGRESNNQDALVGSVPIPIAPLTRPPVVLSLASYQPESTMPEQKPLDQVGGSASSVPTSTKHVSSDALRRAAYLERDRTREMDPGALDFQEAVGADSSEEDEEDVVSNQGAVDPGERGRKRALRIMEARNKVPPEGMWRSLAS